MPLSAPSRPIVLLWALAALASALVAVATAQGIGVTPDGVSYLRLADAFSSSGDLYSPNSWVTTTHFPPGWPLLVGTVSWLTGLSVLGAARVFQVVVAGLVVVVTGRAMAVPGRPIGWLAVVGAGWFGLLYSLFVTSTNALTEPLFVLLCSCALLFVDRFQMHPTNGDLVAACALIAAATLVRYVGIALIVPLIWAIACWPVPARRRWTTLAWAPLATLGPVVLWIANAPPSQAPAIHSASIRTAGVDDAFRSLEQLATALAPPPESIALPVFAALATVTVVALLVAIVRVVTNRSVDPRERSRRRQVLLPWAAFGISYVLLVSAQRWWIDREIISRYWIPAVLAVGVVVIRTVGLLEPAPRRAIGAITALLVISTLWNGNRIIERAEATREAGIGFNRPRYEDSEAVEALRGLGRLEVLTDNPAAVAFQAPLTVPRDLLLDRVHDRDCRDFDQRAIARLTPPAAVALVASCNTDESRNLIDRLAPGANVVSDPRVGTVFIWPGAP